MKKPADILKNMEITEIMGNKNIVPEDIVFDSRKVAKNTAFFAIKGTQVDGHQYIDAAIEKGASVIVCEQPPPQITPDVTYIMVKNSEQALAVAAANFYGHPSEKLRLIGITGTNGKTTIATLLYSLFEQLGHKSGLISTIKYAFSGTVHNATHTTPDVVQINKLLHSMVEKNCAYCFMEVSSHAIKQHRVHGLQFNGGIFTNITHEHLDYHGTFDDYLKTKQAFFNSLPEDAFALSNADDKNGKIILQNTRAAKYFYAMKSFADFRGKIMERHLDGMLLNINNTEMWTKLTGDFNAYNLLAIYAYASIKGIDKREALKVLSSIKPVDGRFETIVSSTGVYAIVDYAHTPDALQNVLNTINKIRKANQQLITVVGAGGNRDKTKRPLMGKISAELSSKIILTSDNPRYEKPEVIISEMQEGIDSVNKQKMLVITDRQQAIKTAVMMANKGDIVLVAGKGHEKYQEINGIRHHFDDKEVINEIFNDLI